jgi:hypothetical protein
MLMHYFLYSSGPDADPIKCAVGHVTSNLYFCIPCDLGVRYCVLVPPEHETLMHYISCSGGPDADPMKSASGHNTLNLCFCIWCDLWVI